MEEDQSSHGCSGVGMLDVMGWIQHVLHPAMQLNRRTMMQTSKTYIDTSRMTRPHTEVHENAIYTVEFHQPVDSPQKGGPKNATDIY